VVKGCDYFQNSARRGFDCAKLKTILGDGSHNGLFGLHFVAGNAVQRGVHPNEIPSENEYRSYSSGHDEYPSDFNARQGSRYKHGEHDDECERYFDLAKGEIGGVLGNGASDHGPNLLVGHAGEMWELAGVGVHRRDRYQSVYVQESNVNS
jgi:hypothetical protein